MAAIIRVEQLQKSFIRGDQEITVLANMNLEIEQGSFVVVVGPSGCGKSTLLNIIAGLLPASAGQVYYKDRSMVNTHLEIGYLTQKDTLMPWRNVEQNITMPLEIRGIGQEERERKTRELITSVGLQGCEKHYPHELSGGMLRRVCLARMLSTSPETLLLDEPFGALDAQLRMELQTELLRLWLVQYPQTEHRKSENLPLRAGHQEHFNEKTSPGPDDFAPGARRTVLFITHDIEEAIVLGDRVVVLGSAGRIILDENIDLPRPRDAVRIRFQPEFAQIHQRLWAALSEARKPQEINA
ncbi:MAG TPA: ABC transporter ATP-binding protein [Ktedonobacteraceae bacterium]|jgi:NitT/TauT family transport system ATP-binding protein